MVNTSERLPTTRSADTSGSAADGARRAPESALRVYGALALGIICIAFSAIFVRWAEVPGTVSALYRVAVAVVVLGIPFARTARAGRVPWDRRTLVLAIGAGIFFSLDLALWNTSIFMTSVANATLLGNDAPIIVGLAALLLLRERLGLAYWLGLAIALSGMTLIVGLDVISHSGLGGGDLLALAAGAAYGGYMLVTQLLRARMDTLPTLWIAGAVGIVILLPVNIAQHHALWGFSARDYLALLGLGLTSQVVGWLAINYALGHLPASVVSPTLLGQPILTALLGVPLLGEALSGRQALGGLVALAGIYLVNRGVRVTPRGQRDTPDDVQDDVQIGTQAES
jgi:drug/metabolite transporter (DMT)-like permease